MSLKIKHLKEPDKPLGSQHTTTHGRASDAAPANAIDANWRRLMRQFA